jgi:RNA polymerase sigma-B factor
LSELAVTSAPSAAAAPARRPPGPAAAALRARFVRSRAGDQRAREGLIVEFLPLARRMARRYQRSSEAFDDLLQVANLGLVNAVDRFDPDRGVAFSSFAVPTILGELRRHFRDTGWSVHVPRALHERALRVERVAGELEGRRGRSVTPQDVADELGLSLEATLEAMEAGQAYGALSIDAPIRSEDGSQDSLIDQLGDEDAGLTLVEDRATVVTSLQQLPLRDRRVLAMRFHEELTQTQIAARVGVSQMQVSRIIRRSLARLRELAEAEPRPRAGQT